MSPTSIKHKPDQLWVGGRTGEQIAAAKADVNSTDPKEMECFE